MISKVMLTMESRIHGDMYVRFGGGLAETYHRKVAKRCWPSPLKEIADLCTITKVLTYHLARHTFATTITLSNGVPIETVSQMLGHNSLKTTQHYAKVIDTKVSAEMSALQEKLLERNKDEEDAGDTKVMKLFR